MAALIEKPRDVVAGLAIVAAGVGFLVFGRELDLGSASRMGPGYFPTVLSWIMVALGAVLAGLALRKPAEEGAFGRIAWLGLLLITGAVILFGATLRGIGLIPAVFAVVLVTSRASRYAGWVSSLLLAAGIAAFCAVLFVRLLGLPLPLLGPWVSLDYWSPSPPASAPADPAAAPTSPQ